MARFKVIHSEDAACILIEGDKRNPEPSTAVIRFPGGAVEVSRCTDGSYWAHVSMIRPGSEQQAGVIVESRIDYVYGAHAKYPGQQIPPIPAAEDIEHMAIRIQRTRG